MDMASLPSNLQIGPGLRATRIFIDRPMTHDLKAGRSSSTKRFNTVGRNTLLVDTPTTPPARIVGLEFIDQSNRTGNVPCSSMIHLLVLTFFLRHGLLTLPVIGNI